MDKLGKIRRDHWKEHLNISKIVKFESDTFYASKNIALQSCENLQTFVWWGASLSFSLMPRYSPGMGVRGFPLTGALGLSTELKMVSFQMNGIWHK